MHPNLTCVIAEPRGGVLPPNTGRHPSAIQTRTTPISQHGPTAHGPWPIRSWAIVTAAYWPRGGCTWRRAPGPVAMATPESASIDPTRLRRACAADVANLSIRRTRTPFCGAGRVSPGWCFDNCSKMSVEGGVLIGFAVVGGSKIRAPAVRLGAGGWCDQIRRTG